MALAIEVLMVEDNRGDVVLVQEAVAKAGLDYHINVVADGVEALEYLQRRGRHTAAPRPDLIVLDLKLPRRSGREFIADIDPEPALRQIPTVVLSSSRSELELAQAQALPSRICLVKPSTFPGYIETARRVEAFRQECQNRPA